MTQKVVLALLGGVSLSLSGIWFVYRHAYPFEFIRTFGGVEISAQECPIEACPSTSPSEDDSRYWLFTGSSKDLSEAIVSQVGQAGSVSKWNRAGCSPFGSGNTHAAFCQLKNPSGKGPNYLFQLMP